MILFAAQICVDITLYSVYFDVMGLAGIMCKQCGIFSTVIEAL